MPNTKDLKETLQHEIDLLSQARDELKVQLHLAKADARAEWSKLETNWLRIEDEIKRLGREAKGPIADVSAASRKLVDDLKQGYARLRTQLTSNKQ